MRIVAFLLVAIGLSGCAVPSQRVTKVPAVINTKTPECEGKTQCDAMWIDAQEAVQMATGMRIRLLTDSRIETFAPTHVWLMGGVVTKYPVSDRKYEIRLSLECYRNYDCSDAKPNAINLFNLHVGGYSRK